jgi:hypothetical protein
MTQNKMTLQEVIEYLNNDESNDDFAFRGDDYIPADGDAYRNSWYHGDDADEFELDGVSAIHISTYRDADISKSICLAKAYGNSVVLLRGRTTNAHEWANDFGECLVKNNEVVCVIDAEFIAPVPSFNPWKIANA